MSASVQPIAYVGMCGKLVPVDGSASAASGSGVPHQGGADRGGGRTGEPDERGDEGQQEEGREAGHERGMGSSKR